MGDPGPGGATPVVGFVLTVQAGRRRHVEKIRAAGGTEALPKAHHPGIGHLAYWKDTESNIVGVLEPE